MKILAFGAHPDDIEFLCAGTLSRLHQRGEAVALATLNSGSCGSATLGPEEIVRVRRGEAERSAALLGAEYYAAGVPDLEAVFDNPTRRRVAEILRRAQPDVVLTHYPQDYMLDHEMTSLLVRDATFTAALRNYPTQVASPAPVLPKVPYLYYCAPLEGLDYLGRELDLDFFVDVSAEIQTKIDMLCCHASQREWLRRQHGMDEYVEFMKRESARIGASRGWAYGEAFRQHRGHAYPHDNVLEKLLAG